MQPLSFFNTISGLECALHNLRHLSFSGPADILPLQYSRSWCEALGSWKILAFERFWLSTLKVTVNPERHVRLRRVGENKREQGGILFSTTPSYVCIQLLKKKRNLSNLTGQWCLSPWQPQGARRRSYFGVSVARFVGRRCGGDTTQGVTPPHPPLSLDLLSGTPCMEQGILSVVVLPGMSMLPGGALSCPTSNTNLRLPQCMTSSKTLDGCLHSACDVFPSSFSQDFTLFILLSHNLIFLNSAFWAWIKEWSPYKVKGTRPQGLTNLLGWHTVSPQNCAWFVQ